MEQIFEPKERRELLKGWLIHDRKGWKKHAEAARRLERQYRLVGVFSVALSAIVGASLFVRSRPSLLNYLNYRADCIPIACRGSDSEEVCRSRRGKLIAFIWRRYSPKRKRSSIARTLKTHSPSAGRLMGVEGRHCGRLAKTLTKRTMSEQSAHRRTDQPMRR